MGTAGQIVGGGVGAVVGSMVGMPMLGYSIGSSIGGMLDPPKLPAQFGPRLQDLTVQTATYGATIPRGYGMFPVNGNVIWLENNSIKEVATTQTQGGKGGPTQQNTQYSYYATFAVALCEGEAAGVSRIWIGSRLVFDISSGANLQAIAASYQVVAATSPKGDPTLAIANNSIGGIRFYPGSETQNPDPRMQASLGVNACPAYRGICYLVIEDLNLHNYGNNLMGAQVKVELIKDAVDVPPVITQFNAVKGGYSTFGTVASCIDYTSNSIWCVDNSSGLISKTDIFSGVSKNYSIGANPVACCFDPITSSVWVSFAGGVIKKVNIFSGVAATITTAGANPYNIVFDNSTNSVWVLDQLDVNSVKIGVLSGAIMAGIQFGLGYITGGCFDSMSNAVWACGGGFGTGFVSKKNIGTLAHTLHACVANPAGISYDYITNSVWVTSSTALFVTKMNTSSFAVATYAVAHAAAGNCVFNAINNAVCTVTQGNFVTSTDIFTGVSTYRAITATSPRADILSDVVTQSLWYTSVGDTMTRIGGPIKTGLQVPVSDIVKNEILKSNLLLSTDVDTSLITQTCRGFRISNVASVRSSLSPLSGTFPFDIIQKGYKLKCIPRGNTSIQTINWKDLDAHSGSGQSGTQIKIDRDMDILLPQRVEISFLDILREYNVGSAFQMRANTDSVHISRIDLPIVLTPTEATNIANTLLYLYWMERFSFTFKLPAIYNQLEPTDIITVVTDSQNYELRLTDINYTSDGTLECVAKPNKSGIYTVSTVAETAQAPYAQLGLNSNTVFEPLDIPSIIDQTNQPGLSVALHGTAGGWTSGVLYNSADSGFSWNNIFSATPAAEAVIGYCTNLLTIKTLDQCALICSDEELHVPLVSGSLSSVTQQQMLNGVNYFAYGVDSRWEIIAAQNCVLQIDVSYILSNILRGRFGTEWATGLHVIGDKLIKIDTQHIGFISQQTSSIGLNRDFTSVTMGNLFSSGLKTTFAYKGINLKPLSPIRAIGSILANDWTISWSRRTRNGGDLRDNVDVALDETLEQYDVEIYSDNTFTNVKRVIVANTSSLSYTSAQQIADFGANQTALYVKIYQISSVIGRGFPLIASL